MHDQNRRRLLQGGLLAAVTATPAWAQPASAASSDRGGPPPAVGTLLPLPDFTLFDGRTLTQAGADGQVLVLYWWASWCPFCALQSPLMDKLWLAQRSRGLQFWGLSIDRKLEDATAKITDARGSLRDLKELAALQANALTVPVDLARVQVALAELTSPVNGVVVSVATAGSVLAPGATAVTIRESRPSTVTAWLAPSELARVCAGDAASVVGDWMTGDGVPATLTRIGTSSDYPPTSVATNEVHLTRAVEVEVTATEQLPPGVPVELHINSCHSAAGISDTDR